MSVQVDLFEREGSTKSTNTSAKVEEIVEALREGFDVQRFVQNFEILTAGVGGVAQVRRLVLGLAVRGAFSRGAGTASESAEGCPFPIPGGWRWRPLGDCAQLADGPFGSKLKSAHYVDESGFRVLRLGNIGLGAFKPHDRSFVTQEHFLSLAPYHLQRDDLLVASLGNPPGRACLVPDDALPAINKADCFRVRVSDQGLAPEYLVNVLNSEFALARAVDLHRGDTRGRITLSHLRDTPIPVPPLAEQKRIVAKVDQLMAFCDELESRQAKKRETGARLTKSALEALTAAEGPEEFDAAWKSVVENFDVLIDRAECVSDVRQAMLDLLVAGSDPAQARACSLVDVVEETRYGTARRCDRDGSKTPVLRIPNVVRGKLELDDMKYTHLPPDELAELRLRAGDLLVVRSNGSRDLVGRTCVVDARAEGFAFAGYLIRLRVKPQTVLPTWLHLAMQGLHVRRAIEGPARTTSGVHNVNTKELLRLPLRVPPLEEQAHIVTKLEQLMKICDELEAQLLRAEDRAAKLVEAAVQELVA